MPEREMTPLERIVRMVRQGPSPQERPRAEENCRAQQDRLVPLYETVARIEIEGQVREAIFLHERDEKFRSDNQPTEPLIVPN